MLCEWLARGAMCSAAHRYLGLPRGTSCTEEEALVGRALERALASLRDGRALKPGDVHSALLVLLSKSGTEAALQAAVREEAVGIDWDYCPLGFALGRRVTVFAGSLVESAEELYEGYSWLFERFGMAHVFAKAADDAEREEAYRKYGAEAVITCLRRPPWRLKTYVVSCDWPNPAARLLARAMGLELYRGGQRLAPGIYVVS